MEPIERLKQILTIVRDDQTALGLIEDVCKAAVNYVTAVYAMETTLAILRPVMTPEIVRERTEKLDSLRSIAHDTLIDAIRICNRYVFKRYGVAVPAGGIYSKDPLHIGTNSNRYAIGEWAGELVSGFFTARHK